MALRLLMQFSNYSYQFMVFERKADELVPFELSPHVMRWSETIWLLDLTPVVSYWMTIAKKTRCDLIECFNIQRFFERGVLAGNPWQAVLLLHALRERNLSGLWSFDAAQFGSVTRFSSLSLWQSLSWSAWQESIKELACHLTPAKREALLRGSRELENVAKKLNVTSPYGLAQFKQALPLKRRFGKALASVWEWTFGDKENVDSTELFKSSFPWAFEKVQPCKAITRFFDLRSPLSWGQLEPFLQEDLDRLFCSSALAEDELVLSLEWVLSLTLGSRLVVPINFRHPYNPRREHALYKTALLQAFYSYESERKDFFLAEDELRLVPDAIEIQSWKLQLSERFKQTYFNKQLFEEECERENSIASLENCLPVTLEQYEVVDHWVPEESFKLKKDAQKEKALGDKSFHIQALKAQGKSRPLFIEKKPFLFDTTRRSKGWMFCERVSGIWWGEDAYQNRDYYKVTDDHGLSYWVYKTDEHKFYMHGIFA
jgi:hypothetical protein